MNRTGAASKPSDYGWRAAEPQLHTHRMIDGRAEAYDARTEGEIEYEVLRDTIVAAFNPPDEDAAEPSIMTAALDRAYAFIVGQPCTCPPDVIEVSAPCARCDALGWAADRPLPR